MICIGCNKQPHELREYVEISEEMDYDHADDAVRFDEGTYNPANGHFYCTRCYLRAGMPLGVAP